MESVTLQALADRVAQGERVQASDAALILNSHDLITIGMMADEVRRQRHGSETTFLRVFEVHVDAVPAALPSNVAAGEFRIVGRPSTVDAACAAVSAARRLAGSGVVNGFLLNDLAAPGIAQDVFARLRAAGLDGLAEVRVDELADGGTAIREARVAGLSVQRLTVTAPPQDPVALLAQVERLEEEIGGFRAFAPLARTVSISTPTTGYDDVKLIALARLIVRQVPSIQVDWALYGPKLAQVALTMGADDVDGVEAHETGALGARRAALEEIRGNIRAAGLSPVERDGRFERASS